MRGGPDRSLPRATERAGPAAAKLIVRCRPRRFSPPRATARRQEATSEERIRANLATLDRSLVSVVEKVRTLEADKAEIDVYELRHVIDREFPNDLDDFVQARYSLVHVFGLQQFADVMNPFAAGERYLNRVWSASTDGYIDEAHTYVDKAREQFELALEILRGLESSGSKTA